MVESSREYDPNAKLMSEVRVCDCLYNKYSRDFKDKYKKMRAKTITQETQHNNHGGQRPEKTRKDKKELYGIQAEDYTRHGSFLVFRIQEKLEKTRKDKKELYGNQALVDFDEMMTWLSK